MENKSENYLNQFKVCSFICLCLFYVHLKVHRTKGISNNKDDHL